jgi:hypothetical protein
MTNDLRLTCEECDERIADGDGYLTVSLAAIHRREQAEQECEQENLRRTTPGGLSLYSAADLLTVLEIIRWRVLHSRCDPDPEGDDYWIAVERIKTPSGLLELTAHLIETKAWLEHTDYADLLRRIATDLTSERDQD